jgi:hypothetical protein
MTDFKYRVITKSDIYFQEALALLAPVDNEAHPRLSRYRNIGMHSYVMAQPSDLPFGLTREDLLIVAPQ